MAVYFGNTKLDAMQYAGHNITQISYLGKIYKLIDDVSITFIEAGVSTTVKYPIGATVSRNTAPSGASFVGWSRSSNGASPVATFTAAESATYYRVLNVPAKNYVNFSGEVPRGGVTYGPFTIIRDMTVYITGRSTIGIVEGILSAPNSSATGTSIFMYKSNTEDFGQKTSSYSYKQGQYFYVKITHGEWGYEAGVISVYSNASGNYVG